MTELMLEGFGGDQRKAGSGASGLRSIQCYHVNARFASEIKDMGTPRIGKALLVPRFLAEALWCRFRYGANSLYYCPTLPAKVTLIRDILILSLLRPFFKRTVFYWHAAGLGEWLESGAAGQILAKLGHRALGRADLSLTPAAFNLEDLRKFSPKRSFAVPYGIPDPCPNFDSTVLPLRREQTLIRKNSLQRLSPNAHISILYMALCTEEKGLLDAVKALQILKQGDGAFRSSYSFTLTVAGKFLNSTEEMKFWNAVKAYGLEKDVVYAGFIAGTDKNRLLATSDIFCFPSYFCGESFGVVIVEAMAFGLPIVTTRWRAIPEFFAPDYPGLVDIKSPAEVASAILAMLQLDVSEEFRKNFLQKFTLDRHLQNLSDAFLSVDPDRQEAISEESSVAG